MDGMGEARRGEGQFAVVQARADNEIRRYAHSVFAEVIYDPAQMRGDRDGGFVVHANYIGCMGNPKTPARRRSP